MRRAHQLDLIQAQLEPVLKDPRGWTNVKYAFPYLTLSLRELGRKDFRVRLDLAEYDLEAPRVAIVQRFTGSVQPRRNWPLQSRFTNLTDHPDTGTPWCCTVGVREYHDHYHHQHDSWDAHRNWMDLHTILRSLVDLLATPGRGIR